jgi:predicted amidohydrolase
VRVTVCQLPDDLAALAQDWKRLVAHVHAKASQVVLLPEMAFYPWFMGTRAFSPEVWQAALVSHDLWLRRLVELAPAVALGTRPVNVGQARANEGYVWDIAQGYRAAHHKYYLPDEEGYWEASWYQRGNGHFDPLECGHLRVGFAICTEMWFMQHARAYGQAGIHILVCPRATPRSTLDKWLAGGRAAAVVSGAFCLSSNHISLEEQSTDCGGEGWVIGPDGEVLALTSQQTPFVTVDVDLPTAEQAKRTYPRYVLD